MIGISGKSEDSKYNLHDSFLDLEISDLKDPIVNVAAGIRWLSYKYTKPKTGNPKNLFNMLRGYNDWIKGEEYAHKVINLYNASFTKRFL